MTINWLTGDVEFFVSKPAWGAEDDADVSEADPLDSPTKLEDDDSSSSTIGASIGLAIVIISIMML